MKIKIKAARVSDPAFNGKTIALFMEDGETPLPCQVAISTAFDAESGQSHVTVTFQVDGDNVKFE